jgi:hypothetical protein
MCFPLPIGFFAAADLKKEKKLSGGASSTGSDLVFPLFKQNPHRWVKVKPKYFLRALGKCAANEANHHARNDLRRGRESNPRIAVLQTATLPLGYPARYASSERNAST